MYYSTCMEASLGRLDQGAPAYSCYPPPAASSYFPPGLNLNGAAPEPAMATTEYFTELDACPPGPDFYYSPPVFGATPENDEVNMSCGDDWRRRSAGGNGHGRPSSAPRRVGFRTRSEVDVLDDGFKWRKYGKKAVKSSPNPRNYYRCSAEGCGVKKRVERDRDDPRYVLTTYDGVHNHAAPGGAAHRLSPLRVTQAAGVLPGCPTAPPVATAPWTSAPSHAYCDTCTTTQLHAAAAAAAHSSESSY